MSDILDYYRSIYNQVPRWADEFHQMSNVSLENYTSLRNGILQSRSLEKYEMDYVIIAVNAYRGYEDSIYMHSLAALNTGGSIDEIYEIIMHVMGIDKKNSGNVYNCWLNVLKKLQLTQNDDIESNLLSKEFLSVIHCCLFIATLQSELAQSSLKEFLVEDYDMKKLEDGVLACLLTAGIPVIFEFTKAVDNAKNQM